MEVLATNSFMWPRRMGANCSQLCMSKGRGEEGVEGNEDEESFQGHSALSGIRSISTPKHAS